MPKFTDSFRYAVRGIWYALRTERNMRVHFAIAALALLLGFMLHLTAWELLIVFFAITLVIMAEMVNTAFESLIDVIAPKYHPLAGAAKDVAAGAVLVAALNSLVVAAFLFLPRVSLFFPAVKGALATIFVIPAGILAGILSLNAAQKFRKPKGEPQLQQGNRWQELVGKAKEARRHAYAPYSKFTVGAALLTAGGKIYTGCNVENASYGLSMCAERVAVFKAVAAGEREFKAIAVAGGGENFCFPCGACRQVLAEFCRYNKKEAGAAAGGIKAGYVNVHDAGDMEAGYVNVHDAGDMEVIMVNDRGDIIIRRLSELLPDVFAL